MLRKRHGKNYCACCQSSHLDLPHSWSTSKAGEKRKKEKKRKKGPKEKGGGEKQIH
jgi:hypothetical protein